MTNSTNKKEEQKNQAVKAIATGVAAVVAGGVAIAAAVAMSDKKNQKKVSDAFDGAKEKLTDYIDSVKKDAVVEKNVGKLKEDLNAVKQKIEEKVEKKV
jgi:hypothetical protein